MTPRIEEAIRTCKQIVATAENCEAELALVLDAYSRHPDWTDQDIMILQRRLVLDFAERLCSDR